MPKLDKVYQLFINGEFVEAENKATIDVFNPATGAKLASIAEASKKDVDKAVKAARRAFEKFRFSTVADGQRQTHS